MWQLTTESVGKGQTESVGKGQIFFQCHLCPFINRLGQLKATMGAGKALKKFKLHVLFSQR